MFTFWSILSNKICYFDENVFILFYENLEQPTQRSEREFDLIRMKLGTWNQMYTAIIINSVFILPDSTKTIKYPNLETSLGTRRQIHI